MFEPKVLCLVPQLPPAIDGVGDYALSLAKTMRQNFGIDTHFIVCVPSWKGNSDIEGFSVSKLENRTISDLLNELQKFPETNSVFVNYVLHEYAARGCPFWLVDALISWKKNATQTNLITMFHEAHPDLRGPWSTDFWLQPVQRYLSNALAQASDHVLVTCPLYLRSLKESKKLRHEDIDILPVFSTVGEIRQPRALADRHPRLVIFGKPGNKANAYRALEGAVSFLKRMGIEEIYDIGPSVENVVEIGQIPIVKLGEQPKSIVSDILSESRFGFLSYKSKMLTKSSIFAAYCSHGLASFNCRDERNSPSCKLVSDVHYLTTESKDLNCSELQFIADSAYAWYQGHNQLENAHVWASKLLKNSTTQLIKKR